MLHASIIAIHTFWIATILALQYYIRMTKNSTNKLSPIDRATRNTVVLFLYNAGYTVSAIARVMKMSDSTVSRVTDMQVDNKRLMEIIFGS